MRGDEDVMIWLKRQAKWHKKPDFMPLGTTLTWVIVRNNTFVGEVTTDDGMAGL